MDPEKVQAVAEWPQPRSTRAVRGFLGLAGYYRKFVKEFGVVAAPLTALLRKDGFSWSPEAAAAFTALKTAVTTAPVLALPDFTRPFIVECDASTYGFGPSFFRTNTRWLSLAGQPRHVTVPWQRMNGNSSAWCSQFAIGGRTYGGVSLW